MATSSALYGLPVPDNRDAPDMPKAMTDYTKKLESVLSAELGKGLRSRGFIPDGSDVLTLDYGLWTQSANWEPKGIVNLPQDARAKAAGTLEVIPFAGGLRMLRWTTAALNSSAKPYSWVRFQGYSNWGPWNELSPEQAVSSVASLKGAITAADLVNALLPDIEPLVDQAVSEAAIEAATGDIQAFDARYRVEHDGTNNVVFGKDAARLRKYPEVRNNTVVGLRALYNLTKGRYNDFFGGEAGYYLDGAGFSESEGKASRNAGFGTNTQRFNRTGMNNVTMGRNAMQCNVGGVNNTYIGAGSAQGIAHMRLSDGVIENQLPLEVWGNAALGTATHRYGMGNQNTAVGGYALSEIKLGDGNVALGASALESLGKDAGYNGKTKVDVSSKSEWAKLTFSIANEALTFTAPTGHGLDVGYMLQCKIESYETQFWYVSEVSGQTVKLTVGMPGYTKTGTMQVLEYYTTTLAPAPSGNIGIGRRAGKNMDNGAPATAVVNAVAIGEDSTFIGDNTISLGNSSQTVHVYAPIQVRSDARDKKDVTDISYGLGFIRSLRPVSYRLAPRAGDPADDRLHAGFIAQEVEAAAAGTDFEGVTVNGDAFSIAYEELVPALVRAVQELADEVTMLKEAS